MIRDTYTIEVTKGSAPQIYKNGHDVYIKILFKDSNKGYFIPVMLPRRNPRLNFYDEIKKGVLSDALYEYLDSCAEDLGSESVKIWKENVVAGIGTSTTQQNQFLKILVSSNMVCSSCCFSPLTNNPQKPIQFLRDAGYIISVHRAVFCPKCNKNTVHYALTPVLTSDKNNYEKVPPKLKAKICEVFGYIDAYTEMYNPAIESFIADHKFPEDRWDEETAEINSDDMKEDEIKAKFQLLSTQINLHKQRHCAACIAEGKRGYPYGIKFYYQGSEEWDDSIPSKGSEAEAGCVGCGWYDLLKWKEELNKKINGED